MSKGWRGGVSERPEGLRQAAFEDGVGTWRQGAMCPHCSGLGDPCPAEAHSFAGREGPSLFVGGPRRPRHVAAQGPSRSCDKSVLWAAVPRGLRGLSGAGSQAEPPATPASAVTGDSRRPVRPSRRWWGHNPAGPLGRCGQRPMPPKFSSVVCF